MKALVYKGPGAKAWEDAARPELAAGSDPIVRVDTTTICGSLHILKGDVPAMVEGRIGGHEADAMSESTDYLRSPASSSGFIPELADILEALGHLVASVEPAVVFSSLAKLCVPLFSDHCTIEIVEDDQGSYRISYPRPLGADGQQPPVLLAFNPADRISRSHAVLTGLQPTPLTGQRAYAGRVIHSWTKRQPTASDVAIARLLIDRAIATVHQERLAEQARQAQLAAASLRVALISSRQIGASIGILMATKKLTETQAFDLLRTASQHTHRNSGTSPPTSR